ncbi:MAG: Bax inhibitor-1/YccA family protein [Rickettsiales bacterium]|jgi:FtsH-binding integral membrane protein|nr:Bax inhibitor-1/YccA family protein [Rickettsiales bacterium]
MNCVNYDTAARRPSYDAELRIYMLQIFILMAIALAVTGLSAYLAGDSKEFLNMIYIKSAAGMRLSPIGWVVGLAPLFMVFFLSSQINRISVLTAQIMLFLYSVLMGLSLTPIFIIYTGEDIARSFFIVSSVFGVMSIYGYTTKKNLSSFGSLLIMGVIGILMAAIVNLFIASSAISLAISVIGVLLFTGLTAYDVNNLKRIYQQSGGFNNQAIAKIAIRGALRLYLDFINLFLMFLQLTGSKKRR